MREAPYRNAAAFRAGIETRIKAASVAQPHRTVHQLRRQFLLQRFLVRVFASPGNRWVLKGGAGLIVRIPSARHSNDIDLLYAEHEALLTDAVADLRRLADEPLVGDFLRFDIADPVIGTGQDAHHLVAQVKVTAYVGIAEYGGRFPVDLSLNQGAAEPVERVQPRPVVELPGSQPLPQFVLYPLAEQIADKVCAMYGRYGRDGDQPSTRYRDLVDLAVIITHQELDAARTAEALRDEAKRRALELPSRFTVPSTDWEAGYRQAAAGTLLSPELRAFSAALAAVAECLEPLLTGTRIQGDWKPDQMRWV